MSRHVCHAHGCSVVVPPRLLMCRKHWSLVPAPLRDAVWRTYRPGQERTKDPTHEYLAAAQAAIDAVAVAEGWLRPLFPDDGAGS